MPLQETSGAASYDAFGGGIPYIPQYIEDVFQTWLYTGNGGAQTINNGIDLAGKGGLVWTKTRNVAQSHQLVDTVRGQASTLLSNSTNAATVNSAASSVSSFSSTGYVAGVDFSDSTRTYVSWTFREQPKFFDVVTYTGNGTSQNIAHSLGSVPGCIIVKDISTTRAWSVYHTSLGNTQNLILSGTNAAATATDWNNTTPTSTVFTVGNNVRTNASGATYVAYLFAHNAGGFGLSGTDNVISCGSFTTDANGDASVNLGYEPQWLVFKGASGTNSQITNWTVVDNMRGWANQGTYGDAYGLAANTSGAEAQIGIGWPTATGFEVKGVLASVTHIYIAIRRGPMKVPTTGTSVFLPIVKTNSENPQTVDTGFTVDMTWSKGNASTGTANPTVVDRLRGTTRTFEFNSLFADGTNANISDLIYSNGYINRTFTSSGNTGYGMAFARAPQFFDEVCYTGTSPTNQTLAHNLQAVPELIIAHNRSSGNNRSYSAALGPDFFLSVDSANAPSGPRSDAWGAPTASTFEVRAVVNNSGQTFSAYLFASCPGVSKVGSFTGTGATQTINCGFTGGARFVLIKATSTTGDWYVWDTARGMIPSNDPYLMLNVAVPQVTDTDWVDTAATGFQLSNAGGNLANSNGVSYIFLAIA